MKVFRCDMCQGGNVKFAVRVDGDEVYLSPFNPKCDSEVQHVCPQLRCLTEILKKNNDAMDFDWPPQAMQRCDRLHTDEQGA